MSLDALCLCWPRGKGSNPNKNLPNQHQLDKENIAKAMAASGGTEYTAPTFKFEEGTSDPFELPHVADFLPLPPMESTYRTKSGARRAGPRAWIYFHPVTVRAAIVTCGGLCPGLNDVIRQLVFTLETYGVNDILGIQYGFKGFVDKNLPPITLTRKVVQGINDRGGSFLGVSRGHPELTEIVDRLEEWGINMLFVIGGNGSHAGANAIYEICYKRKVKIVVVGIPKTIDNDILLIDKTFGFDTAVEEAQRAINAAYVEAASAFNGIGIVKLMGRQSGFIAMYATIASGQVDVVLIPEVPFDLKGKYGVLQFLKKRLEKYGHCVIVIAEGAAQSFLEGTGGTDASGNPILGDSGKWMYNEVKAYFKQIGMPIDAKYIDPTYMIRARPCNSSDHIYCSVLAQNAVHGAFAGYTNFSVGLVNTHYCLLPIPLIIKQTRNVDPSSNMWHRCVGSTGQPDFVPSAPDPPASNYPLSQRRASSLKQMQATQAAAAAAAKPARRSSKK